MLLSTAVATRLEPPRGRAAKRSQRRNYVSSRSFAHASHCRHAASNCASASSSVAAWPSVRMSAGLPKMRCSDPNERTCQARQAPQEYPGGPCQSRSRRPVGPSLRAILFLTPAPAWQYFASRVSAGRADISDEPLHFLERLNPGHLLHRGLTPWTADHVLLSGIRHNKPQLSSPKLKLVNARTFPLYRF